MWIFETKITPSVNISTGEIHLMVKNTAGLHYTEVMQTKDKATRAALVALGWTPPELKKFIFGVWQCRDVVEDDVKVGTYELLAESHEIAYRIVSHMEYADEGTYYILDKVEDI